MKSKLNISRFRCVWHPVSCWDQHNILLLLLYFDCVLKISKKKLVASLSKVNNQSQFDFIDTNWNFCFLFVFFFFFRDRDVRSLDIFYEKAHPLTVCKVPCTKSVSEITWILGLFKILCLLGNFSRFANTI